MCPSTNLSKCSVLHLFVHLFHMLRFYMVRHIFEPSLHSSICHVLLIWNTSFAPKHASRKKSAPYTQTLYSNIGQEAAAIDILHLPTDGQLEVCVCIFVRWFAKRSKSTTYRKPHIDYQWGINEISNKCKSREIKNERTERVQF